MRRFLSPPPVLVALSSGVFLALWFPPVNFPVFPWIALGTLLKVVLGVSRRKAAALGMLHGAAFYFTSLSWIYTVMREHGRVEPWAAAGVLALMVLVLGAFTAAFALGVNIIARRSVALACVAAPFLWVALEFARTHMPYIGFPWNLLGYGAAEHLGLAQIVSVTGIYGLSFLAAAYNALYCWALVDKPGTGKRRLAVWAGTTAALVVIALAGGRFVPAAEPRYTAHLVQTNIAQATSYPANWMEQMAGTLDEIERMSIEAAKRQPGVIVWPEVPAPFYLQDAKFAERATRIAREGNAPFLVGIVDWKPHTDAAGGVKLEPYNSAALLDASGQRVFAYDKIHLVAFGEYVPLRNWLAFAEKMTAEVGDFRAGTTYAVGELPTASGARGQFGVVICFEAVFPNLTRKFVANGAELLVNISNDGWFGRSGALAQHAAMARVRAIENRRWLLRATNTGETFVVDPYGRETVRLEPGVRGVLTAGYDFRRDLTLYARFGDWLAWLSMVVAAGMVGAAVLKRSKEVRT